MISIVYHDVNITLYRIPLYGNETSIFSIHNRPDPQSLQFVIDAFNYTTIKNNTMLPIVTSNITPIIQQCQIQNLSLIICLTIIFMFILMTIIHTCLQRFCKHHKYSKTHVCVVDEHMSTEDHDDDDDDDDNNEMDKEIVSISKIEEKNKHF